MTLTPLDWVTRGENTLATQRLSQAQFLSRASDHLSKIRACVRAASWEGGVTLEREQVFRSRERVGEVASVGHPPTEACDGKGRLPVVRMEAFLRTLDVLQYGRGFAT